MLERTAGMLGAFLAYYPKDPLADDAAFSLANCLLDLNPVPCFKLCSTAGPGFLCIHGQFKLIAVHRQTLFAEDKFSKVKRKTKGIV